MNNSPFSALQQAASSGRPTERKFNVAPSGLVSASNRISLVYPNGFVASFPQQPAQSTVACPLVVPRKVDSSLNRPGIHPSTTSSTFLRAKNGTPLLPVIPTTHSLICGNCGSTNPPSHSCFRCHSKLAVGGRNGMGTSQFYHRAQQFVTRPSSSIPPINLTDATKQSLGCSSHVFVTSKASGLQISSVPLTMATRKSVQPKKAIEEVTLSSDEESDSEDHHLPKSLNDPVDLPAALGCTPSTSHSPATRLFNDRCQKLRLETMNEWPIPQSVESPQSTEVRVFTTETPKSNVLSTALSQISVNYSDERSGSAGSVSPTDESVVKLGVKLIRFGSHLMLDVMDITFSRDSLNMLLPTPADPTNLDEVRYAQVGLSVGHIRKICYCLTDNMKVVFILISTRSSRKIRNLLKLPDTLDLSNPEIGFFDPDNPGERYKWITVLISPNVTAAEMTKLGGILEVARSASVAKGVKLNSTGSSGGFDLVKMEYNDGMKRLTAVMHQGNPKSGSSNGLRQILQSPAKSVSSSSSLEGFSLISETQLQVDPLKAVWGSGSMARPPTSNSVSTDNGLRPATVNGNLLPASSNTPATPNGSCKQSYDHKSSRMLFPYKQGISVSQSDVDCLEEGEFLNDVIIDFYLRYTLDHFVPEHRRENIHVFSSFFWRSLNNTKKHNVVPSAAPTHPASVSAIPTNPPAATTMQMSNLHKAKGRHRNVKSWTKNVDLFTKDFIVVPINENLHWFLAVICFPYLTEPQYETPSSSEDDVGSSQPVPILLPTEEMELSLSQPACDSVSSSVLPSTQGSCEVVLETPPPASPTSPTLVNGELIGPRRPDSLNPQEAQDYDDEIEQNKMMEKPANDVSSDDVSLGKGNKPHATKRPCIIVFDSLGSAACSHAATVKILRDYLTVEWAEKKGYHRVFDAKVFKGIYAKVPLQDNYVDCGLYVLQYAETFFDDIPRFFDIPLNLERWFSQEKIRGKRKDLKMLIDRLTDEYRRSRPAKRPKLEENVEATRS